MPDVGTLFLGVLSEITIETRFTSCWSWCCQCTRWRVRKESATARSRAQCQGWRAEWTSVTCQAAWGATREGRSRLEGSHEQVSLATSLKSWWLRNLCNFGSTIKLPWSRFACWTAWQEGYSIGTRTQGMGKEECWPRSQAFGSQVRDGRDGKPARRCIKRRSKIRKHFASGFPYRIPPPLPTQSLVHH